MRKMLEELYFGNINPNVKKVISNSQYQQAMQTFTENEQLLGTLLGGKEKKLFIDLMNAQSELSGIITVEYFVEGFRLGMCMGIEVMDKDDGCLVDIT